MKTVFAAITLIALSAPAFAQDTKTLSPAPTVSTQASLLIGALGTTGTASLATVATMATVATVQSTGDTK
ncbi:MAG: hypothetical protein ABJL99_13155 [Aliishimia sp.]